MTDLHYMTIHETAELLRVSTKTLVRWVKADPSLPCLRIGGVVRFPQERLLVWLRSKEQGVGKAKRTNKPLPAERESLARQPLVQHAPTLSANLSAKHPGFEGNRPKTMEGNAAC